ncbi:helix-turn-helix transcriptional regulator [Dongshaea marina]|uniref:helix-turn-helix transcriptional regulator n=1 Tax=Dongshaea marina TaxID=2047966 RepID=UPI000D3E7C2F|nr:WYL domain-containing protein [Dongshaea marina]
MSKKLVRQLTLARCIPYRPYKVTARQLKEKMEEEGIRVSLRTIQRDLEEMSGMGLFDLTSDERSKPHGWCFERNGLNDFANFMPLSLAVALRSWSEQAPHLIPSSIMTEITPVLDKANQVISDSQSESAQRWVEHVACTVDQAGSSNTRHCSTILDSLWRGRRFRAEVKRVIKEQVMWLRYDQLNPLGVIYQPEGPVLLCTVSELDPKVYGIPFNNLRNIEILTRSISIPPRFNMQKLLKERAYLEGDDTFRFVGRLQTSNRQHVDAMKIPGRNQRLSLCDRQSMLIETDVQDSPEFRRWLGEMSKWVEVVSPAALRKTHQDDSHSLVKEVNIA